MKTFEELSEMVVTMVEKPDNYLSGSSPCHRSKIIIRKDWAWCLAEFPTEKAFQKWLDYCGLEIKLEEQRMATKTEWGLWKRFSVNRKVKEEKHFWKKEEVPNEAKPIRLLSNGSIVTGYILNDGEVLHIYRPNPNAKEVYNPLTIEERIKYEKENGVM